MYDPTDSNETEPIPTYGFGINGKLTDVTGGFLLCTTCARLRAQSCPFRPGAVDSCLCEPLWQGPTLEVGLPCVLCQVCGLHPVRGHHKWHFVICRHCLAWSKEFNGRVGRKVLPQGIHSLVNGGPLVSGPDLDQPAVRHQFAVELKGMFGAVGAFADWSERLLIERLRSLGFEAGRNITLEEYLVACRRAGITEETGKQRLEDWFFGDGNDPGGLTLRRSRLGRYVSRWWASRRA
jgi:hypothetical protein